MSSLRIQAQGLGKKFRRRHVGASLLRAVLPGIARDPAQPAEEDFWALRDLSFDVRHGESVALLGRNGSGKSTLLGLLAGAIAPSNGQVSICGRIAPVLGLGVGFEADMTAVENAYLNAALLGIAPDETTGRLAEILAFAELDDFVDVRVRYYSTGMLTRLGFAIAMHVDADVLLVDEALAVGDNAFQSKCRARIRELQKGGLTLVFVTHDLSMAQAMCDRGIWIDRGQVQRDGPIASCVAAYENFSRTRL